MIIEQTASFILAKVGTAFRNSLERQMSKVDLHGGQVFVLIELWKEDGLRQIDLAKRLGVAAPTINKMLKGLGEINLIEIERVQGDGRSTRIFLTEKGYSIRRDVEREWHELEEKCVAALTEAETFMFIEFISRIRKSFSGSEEKEIEV